jgi:transcriptional regulator with XRE-family HTH domain
MLGSLTINLRSLRDAAGLRQDQLAERSGIRQGSISKMETAESVERVSLETLVRLAHGLGLKSPAELFTWEEGPSFGKWQKKKKRAK